MPFVNREWIAFKYGFTPCISWCSVITLWPHIKIIRRCWRIRTDEIVFFLIFFQRKYKKIITSYHHNGSFLNSKCGAFIALSHIFILLTLHSAFSFFIAVFFFQFLYHRSQVHILLVWNGTVLKRSCFSHAQFFIWMCVPFCNWRVVCFHSTKRSLYNILFCTLFISYIFIYRNKSPYIAIIFQNGNLSL